MTLPIEDILKILAEDFDKMEILFDDKEWKFYKFGRGGPYKRTLTHLQEKATKYDAVIFQHFGVGAEIASFSSLINLCLFTAQKPKERYKGIDTFRRQVVRMGKII